MWPKTIELSSEISSLMAAFLEQAGLLLHEALPASAADGRGSISQQGGGEQAEGEGRRWQWAVECPAISTTSSGPCP